jgi:hypothetical protein
MVAYTLRLDDARLQAVGMREARRLVTTVVRRTLNGSAVLCPVDTGNLRASGTMAVGERGAMVVGEVVYTARYAAAVHEGRRALTIRAKGNGRLRFVVDGQVVYARSVRQPARAGRPFLADALRTAAAQSGFRVTIG